jgi:hypothetical protein
MQKTTTPDLIPIFALPIYNKPFIYYRDCRRNEAENYRSSSDYEWITRQKSGFLRILIIENNNLSFDERALINFDHPRAIDFELLVAI